MTHESCLKFDFDQAIRELRDLPIPKAAFSKSDFFPWQCHKGAKEKSRVRFSPPVSKKDVLSWTYKLSRWVALDHAPGKGRAIIAAFRALIDFMDWKTGRLDPAYSTIAKRAKYGRTTIWKALNWLRKMGVIAWIPCCTRLFFDDGRFELRQESNAYALLPPSQWAGFGEKPPEKPAPQEWGAAPALPAGIDAFVATRAEGQSVAKAIDAMAEDQTDELALALARLGRALKPPN